MSMPAAANAPEADPRAPRRVRHEARRRTLTIKQVEKIAAHMIRITLTGDLEGFTSLGFDDHVKLFFPDGTTNAEGAPNALGRDFTPRRYDRAGNTLEIDFAIHDAGPATQWAAQAKPGQTLSIGGPRGSFIIPTTYDWHLLIGDETGLPAISRRLAELPAGTKVVVLCEVDGPADEIKFETKADVTVTWAHRGERGGRLKRDANEGALSAENADRRLLRLGRLRVAGRQGAAPPAHRQPRRQSEMDARRRLLAPRRDRNPRSSRKLTLCVRVTTET